MLVNALKASVLIEKKHIVMYFVWINDDRIVFLGELYLLIMSAFFIESSKFLTIFFRLWTLGHLGLIYFIIMWFLLFQDPTAAVL